MGEIWGTSLVRRQPDGEHKVLNFEAAADEHAARQEVANTPTPDYRYFLAVTRVEIIDPTPKPATERAAP
ncbi:hypothetical protein ACFVAJ_17210 [Agromyces sp. NPDC057679]|uniref:hypothetical protein n=1 Tax=Agromyces sp. NPDC057679 TaxID=3346207 RepID=UPI003671C80A